MKQTISEFFKWQSSEIEWHVNGFETPTETTETFIHLFLLKFYKMFKTIEPLGHRDMGSGNECTEEEEKKNP